MYLGWHQVAFTRDLSADVTPVTVSDRRLMLVRHSGEISAYDAVCPHRGAHLGYGGRLEDGAIVCPFHGRRIRLGRSPDGGYEVRGYRTMEVGGSVYVLLHEDYEHGFTDFLRRWADTHWFVPGFTLSAPITPEYVIENVFDTDHFTTVHGLHHRPQLETRRGGRGELLVEARFKTEGATPWQQGPAQDGITETRFFARVFSPTLVATELGDSDRPHVVISAATPTAEGHCTIRVSLIAAGDPATDRPPPKSMVLALLHDSRRAFEQDMEIWAHLCTDAPSRYAPSDRAVLEYRRFCERLET